MISSGVFGYLFDYLVWWVLLLSLLTHTWCFFKFFPRAKRPRTALMLGNALVTLSLLGVSAMAVETYLRFISVKTDAYGITLSSRRWFLLYTSKNGWGCRDPEWAVPKPPGVRRIALVGDSYTYGWGIERVQDRFGNLLQARFDLRRPGTVEVLNVAGPGWATADQIEPVQYAVETLGVEEVVLCFIPNDIENLVPRPAEGDPTRPPQQSFFNVDSSCLIDYIYRRIYTPYVPVVRSYHDWLASGFTNPQVMAEEEALIERLAASCREKGVRIRAVLLPFIKIGGKTWDSRAIHDTMRAVFERHGIEVLDLLPAIAGRNPRSLVVNSDDAHPNVEAHRLFAEKIWEAFYAQQGQRANDHHP